MPGNIGVTSRGYINSVSFNPDLGESGYIGVDVNTDKILVIIDKAK